MNDKPIGDMPVVYVAGPYDATGACNVMTNIRNGIEACRTLITWGFAPVCPWLDFAYCLVDDMREEDLKAVSMEHMRRSDVVYVNPDGADYTKSAGTLAEINEANRLNIPVFYAWDKLTEWRKRWEAGKA